MVIGFGQGSLGSTLSPGGPVPLQLPAVVWQRADLGVTTVPSAVTAAGTSPPAVTVTGTFDAHQWQSTSGTPFVEIDITGSGTGAAATFQWKLNGVVQQTGQSCTSTFTLGSTNLTANFPNSAYSTDNVFTLNINGSLWPDQTLNGNNSKQATVASQPNLITPGISTPGVATLPSLVLTANAGDTAGTFYSVSDSSSLHPGTGSFHLWAVIQMPAAWPAPTHTNHIVLDKTNTSPWTGAVSDGYGLAVGIGSGSGTGIMLAVGSGVAGTLQSGTIGGSGAGNLSLGNTYLLEYYYDGVSANSLWVNATRALLQSNTLSTNTNTNPLYVAVQGSAALRFVTGALFEWGINIPAPTLGQQTTLQNYVRARYKNW